MDARTPAHEREPQEHEEKPSFGDRLVLAGGTLRAHPYVTAAVIVLIIGVIAGVVIWWLHARQFESTDDAFIDTRTVSLASQVNGAITEVEVTDNSDVDANAVLVHIDERDYRAALEQARAQVAQAQASIENYAAQIEAQQARIDQAKKQVAEARSALTFAQQENTRYQDLLKTGTGTEQRAQQTASDLRQRQAAFDAALANATAAEKQVAVLDTQRKSATAQLAQAEAQRDQAQTNLGRTVIRSPVAGHVSKLAAAKGGYAQVGQSLLMFVPRDVWVTANFKETQLKLMRVGQPVDVTVDAYPDRILHGRVDSIQAGSGAAFALLPPENATGNYVKVVQRVPVKIVFDQPPDVLLGPGMSVVPTVKVR
jgi:membrane fusion protein (multidrug efflux system)